MADMTNYWASQYQDLIQQNTVTWLERERKTAEKHRAALRQARIDALEEAASHVEAKHGYGIALQIAAEIRTLKVDK